MPCPLELAAHLAPSSGCAAARTHERAHCRETHLSTHLVAESIFQLLEFGEFGFDETLQTASPVRPGAKLLKPCLRLGSWPASSIRVFKHTYTHTHASRSRRRRRHTNTCLEARDGGKTTRQAASSDYAGGAGVTAATAGHSVQHNVTRISRSETHTLSADAPPFQVRRDSVVLHHLNQALERLLFVLQLLAPHFLRMHLQISVRHDQCVGARALNRFGCACN